MIHFLLLMLSVYFFLFLYLTCSHSAYLFEFHLRSCALQSYSLPCLFSSSIVNLLGEGWDLSHLRDSAVMSTIGPYFPFFAPILIILPGFPAKDKICCVWICSTENKEKISLKFLKKINWDLERVKVTPVKTNSKTNEPTYHPKVIAGKLFSTEIGLS